MFEELLEKTRKLREGKYDKVGSGELPNKYYVIGTGDFMIEESPGSFNWASEVLGGDWKNVKDTDFGVYDTFEEAVQVARDKAEIFEDEPIPNAVNHIAVEDHISGEVYYIGIQGRKADSIWKEYEFTVDERDESDFTKKEMEKRGEEFK